MYVCTYTVAQFCVNHWREDIPVMCQQFWGGIQATISHPSKFWGGDHPSVSLGNCAYVHIYKYIYKYIYIYIYMFVCMHA